MRSEPPRAPSVEVTARRGATATVLIATYERAPFLKDTLASIAALRTPADITWDVMIVDNNSRDDTRDVVAAAAKSFPVPLKYLFEPRQGKSNALNAALTLISSPIIVFSDDDVRVPPEWLEQAVRPMLERADIAYVGGPVRPLWAGEPPKWLLQSERSAGVLAILDYGPEPFWFEDRRVVPVGANMAVRRSVIDQVGGFHAALDRTGTALVGQGQGEFFARCRRIGARGLYVPGMYLEHLVPARRLSWRYFFRWWFWKGVSHARWYRIHKETELGVDLRSVSRLFGVPLFIYGSALADAARACRALLTGRTSEFVDRSFTIAFFAGYVRESWFGPRHLSAPTAAPSAALREDICAVPVTEPKPPAPVPHTKRTLYVSARTQIKRIIERALERRGHRLIPNWRLKRWDESCHIRDVFEFLKIDCALDVGANIGQYREFLRLHVGYQGHIVSFEPINELYDGLRRASAADPKWSVHRIALGETHAVLDINVMRERTLSSFLPRNEAQLQRFGYTKYLWETEVEAIEPVPVRRLDQVLDDVLPSPNARVFLKSDTQGYDMSVVRGAAACMDRVLGLQVELSVRQVYMGSPNYLEALAELQCLGYELTGTFAVQRDSAHRIVNVDCVMLRTDEAERLRRLEGHSHGN